MKKLTTLLLSFALLLTSFAEEETTQLGKHMDELSGHLKSLRKFDDEDWAGKAEAVKKAQAELLACFTLVPAMLESVPEGPVKAKQMAEYKKLLATNFAQLCELELALYEEDEDLVDDVLSELKSIKKDGHTQFIEEE